MPAILPRRAFIARISGIFAAMFAFRGFARSAVISVESAGHTGQPLGACAACGAENDLHKIAARVNRVQGLCCHSCGVNLISGAHDSDTEALLTLARDGHPAQSQSGSPGDAIPFPNHDYLFDCGKPNLRLSGLKF